MKPNTNIKYQSKLFEKPNNLLILRSTLSNSQKRLLILNYFRKGLNQYQTNQELQQIWGNDAPSLATIYRWFQQFSIGNFDLENQPKEGRLITKNTKENIDAVLKLVTENP